MQFRSLTGDPVKLVLTNKYGPTGDVAVVGEEWRDLPERFWEMAMANGCETSKMYEEAEKRIQVEIEKRVAAATAQVKTQKDILVQKIHELVEENNIGAFLKDGKPKSPVLSKMVGFQVTNALRDECWFLYNEGRENSTRP